MKYQNIPEIVTEYIITRSLMDLSQLTRYKIAENFGINQNYLSEQFKKGTQMTVLEFINFEKMKRAEKLLVSRGDLSVRDISEKIGIVKCKQFRIKFQKIYGLKPGTYRRKIKGGFQLMMK
jgi:two-component system, response regulator YesN